VKSGDCRIKIDDGGFALTIAGIPIVSLQSESSIDNPLRYRQSAMDNRQSPFFNRE
jgi:hypothetical protein